MTRESVSENVSTKADIGNLKVDIGNLRTEISNLKADIGNLITEISNLKVDIERDMARLEVRLMNRMTVVVSVGIAVLGFIIVVVEFIPGN